MKHQFFFIHLIVVLNFMTQKVHLKQVYTQFQGTKNYQKNTTQDFIGVNLGDDFNSTKQFSLWGWFKADIYNAVISNIITLQNLTGNDLFLQSAVKNYPKCPFTRKQIASDTILKNLPEVVSNPYCDYENYQNGKAYDLLLINYDIQPQNQKNNEKYYDLSFLIQSGFDEQKNISELQMETFSGILQTNEWTFFGISADYQAGNIYIYIQTANKQFTKSKNFNIDFPQFKLKNPARLIIARTEENDYFVSQSGFIGQIANVEMSQFFTASLSYQWAGYVPLEQRGLQSIMLDFVYDVYDKENAFIQSYGSTVKSSYKQTGDFEVINNLNKDFIGIRYYQNSHLSLGDGFNFIANDSSINSFSFYFNFKVSKIINNDFVLLTRGKKNQKGYLQITIVHEENQKKIQAIVTDNNNNIKMFKVNSNLQSDKNNRFLIGFAQGLDKNLIIIYADSFQKVFKNQIIHNFPYDMSYKELILFNVNPDQENNNKNEFVDMYRFIIFNSSSPVVNIFNKFNSIYQNSVNKNISQQLHQCQYSTDVYQDEVCFKCQNSISNQKYQCIPYCPLGYKNQLNDVCIPCEDRDLQCKEFQKTTFVLQGINNEKFEIKPTRALLNSNIFYEQFKIKTIENPDQKIDYKFEAIQNTQKAQVTVDVNEDNELLKFEVIPFEQEDEKLVDTNYNLLLPNQVSIQGGYLGNIKKLKYQKSNEDEYQCIVPRKRLQKMRILAYILLISYACVFLALFAMSIVFYRQFWSLGGLWKFLLHHWMKLNLIAFLVLLAINMPCCVREFLHQIYRFTVSWDHELRHWVNNSNQDQAVYNEAFEKRNLPQQFKVEHVRVFVLHNLMISFILQLLIAFFFIVLKVWDLFQTSQKSILFKMLVLWEYTILIVGYLLFHMRDFVFSFLNWRKAIFSHSYFVIGFLISIMYIAVFVLFWIYSLWRLLFNSIEYWSDPINVNKFYYFRAGYRQSKLAKTYDHWITLSHFVVAIMIGLAIYQPLAQMIVSVTILILLLGATILLRPWNSLILFISDLLSQIAILVAVIFFLVFSILDKGSCKYCGDRESSSCWVIVLVIFLFFMLGLIGLLGAMILDCRQDDSVQRIIENEDIYHEDQKFVMEYGSKKIVYPIAQDQLDQTSRIDNFYSYINRDTSTINLSKTQTNMMMDDRSFDRTVKQVRSVRPDEVDEDSIQDEIFELMNDKSLSRVQQQIEMADNSRILEQQKKEFYKKFSQEKKTSQNQSYKTQSNFGKF